MASTKKIVPLKTAEEKIKEYEDRRADIRQLFERNIEPIGKLLPEFMNAKRFIEMAINAVTRKPEIMSCTNTSLLTSVMFCAELGLVPDSLIGEVYLTSEESNGSRVCGITVGYKGFCALAMRSGKVQSIQAHAVFEGDEFDHDLGSNQFIKHKRTGSSDKSKMLAFYAIVKLMNGGEILDVMPMSEVEQVRDNSKNYQMAVNKAETAWVVYLSDMGSKTVLRRLFKFTPISTDITKAVSVDEAAEIGKQKISTDYQDTSQEFKNEALHQLIEDQEGEKTQRRKDSAQRLNNKGAKAMSNTLQNIKNATPKKYATKSGK